MNLIAFVELLSSLAVATGKTLDDETVAVYFKALGLVPFDTLQAAVGRLIASARFFPSVGEIRAVCDHIGAASRFQAFTVPALVPDGALRDDDPRLWYACPTCQDSGWAPSWCPGSVHAAAPEWHEWASVRPCGSNACARFGAQGYGHEFMTRCPCYTSNPKIRERLAARKTYAEQP